MGRRKVEVAPSTADAPAEPTNVRRSSRLAVKERVEYNEARMSANAMEKYSGKRKVSPRSTKKEKTKLTKGGAMAVRIVHETFTSKMPPPSSKGKAPHTKNSRTETALAVIPLNTVASSMMSINETPVSTRTRKQAPLRGRAAAAALATLDEVDSSLPSASDCSFQSTTVSLTGGFTRPISRSTITPESVQVTSSTSVRKRPSKQAQRKDKTVSPDEQRREVPRGQPPRATRLFGDDDEDDDDVIGLGGDASFDDAMVAPMDVTLLTEEELPPEIVVPEKRRKRDTVVKQDTVAPKKDTVAKKSPAVKQTAANKKTRATPSPPAARPAAPRARDALPSTVAIPAPARRQARGPSVIMQRVLYTDDLEITSRRDDAFAGEFSSAPGDLDRSMHIAGQLEAGTLAIEDLAPEDRILAELFSPAKSPRLDTALRNAVPLVLTSSSSSPSAAAGGGRKGKGRAARTKAAARLSDHCENESDEDEEAKRSPTGTVYPPDEMAYIRSANRLKRSPYIRELFKASAASYGGDIEPQMETRQASRRRKIQYPGIAPIPEDPEEATQAAADYRDEQLNAFYRTL